MASSWRHHGAVIPLFETDQGGGVIELLYLLAFRSSEKFETLAIKKAYKTNKIPHPQPVRAAAVDL